MKQAYIINPIEPPAHENKAEEIELCDNLIKQHPEKQWVYSGLWLDDIHIPTLRWRLGLKWPDQPIHVTKGIVDEDWRREQHHLLVVCVGDGFKKMRKDYGLVNA